MSVVLVGLDHHRVPLDVLERLAIGTAEIPEVLDRLAKSDHVTEAVVLSTCMRTEIYVEAVRFHGAVSDIHNVLAEISGIPVEMFAGSLCELHDDAAYNHLFRVASGVESAVVGEGEILGQVARAWETAREHGTSRSILSALFRHAVGVGKRARNDTAIARGITSIGQAAVVMATEQLQTLDDKNVLIVGAGDMGDSMAVALSCAKGAKRVHVSNRTPERADGVAARVGGTPVPWGAMLGALADADLVLTSTGSPKPIISVEDVQAAMDGRSNRSLVIVDVAVPRDVEHGVSGIAGVTLLDLESLTAFATVGRAERALEIAAVEQIVNAEVATYIADVNARTVTPIVRAVRERAEAVRVAELERVASKLDQLEPQQRDAVEALTKAMLAKLLHEPTVRLKEVAGTPEGERMADALRLLFGV